MMFIPDVRHRRPAFSLIELLVVIAILAVLMSLITSAVFRYLDKGPELACRTEMGGLATAIAAFKEEFNVAYLPSRLRLREDGQYSLADPLERRTQAFLQQMFGKRFNPTLPRDWNNSGGAPEILNLQGQATLVFLLGGIPNRGTPNGCLGFGQALNPSTGQLDPIDVNPATGLPNPGSRKGPFYDFRSNRLLRGTQSPTSLAPNNMFVFLDPFGKGKPYAYFSSGKAGNDYDTLDCQLLGVNAYRETPATFVNPNGFQIISAGKDGQFGLGLSSGAFPWTPALGYNNQGPGADDFANFSRLKLGAGMQ